MREAAAAAVDLFFAYQQHLPSNDACLMSLSLALNFYPRPKRSFWETLTCMRALESC